MIALYTAPTAIQNCQGKILSLMRSNISMVKQPLLNRSISRKVTLHIHVLYADMRKNSILLLHLHIYSAMSTAMKPLTMQMRFIY